MECFEKWFSKTIWKKRIVLFKVTFGGGFPMLCCTFEVIFERIFENDVQKNLEKKWLEKRFKVLWYFQDNLSNGFQKNLENEMHDLQRFWKKDFPRFFRGFGQNHVAEE